MGFGVLFIGYFLLLNVTYYSITDIIAASVMMLGLYKLSSVNKYFKVAFFTVWGLFVLGGLFLFNTLLGMFSLKFLTESLIGYLGAIRYLLIGVFTFILMMALRDIAKELELNELAAGCLSKGIISSVVFSVCFILQLPLFTGLIPDKALAYLFAGAIIAELIALVMNLSAIYSCYMKICMPEDNLPESDKEPKRSRFEFINQYREHKEQKAREEAQYRLSQLKKKSQKGGKHK